MEMQRSTKNLCPRSPQHACERIPSSLVSEFTERCIICLDNINDQCEARPCGHHMYHFLCLVTWLEQRAACPLCNGNIHEVRYEVSANNKQGKIYKVPERSKNPDDSARPRLPYVDIAIERRRYIYRHNLYSLHVGSNNEQLTGSAYSEFFPQLLATDARLTSRAKMWLRRELRVFQFLNTVQDFSHDHGHSNMEYLVEYIIAILTTVDIQDSTGHAENIIQEYLGRKNTQLFLHELKAWLRSPYESLSAWDWNVQYKDGNTRLGVSHDTSAEIMQHANVALKYNEPAGVRKPTQAWRLYVFMDSQILETIDLWERSVWLFGRDKRVVDIMTGHPSCSGQHAVLQFLYSTVDKGGQKEGGERGKDGYGSRVGLYLIDLDSTHGTRLNGEVIKSERYVEIKNKDLIKFGGSGREYILILPPA